MNLLSFLTLFILALVTLSILSLGCLSFDLHFYLILFLVAFFRPVEFFYPWFSIKFILLLKTLGLFFHHPGITVRRTPHQSIVKLLGSPDNFLLTHRFFLFITSLQFPFLHLLSFLFLHCFSFLPLDCLF